MLPGPGLAVASPATGFFAIAVLACYALAQILLLIYSSHRYLTLWRWARGRGQRPPASTATNLDAEPWPVVTVQLPLYNEPAVARRLIDAVAALDYPRDRLEIQVLDDSTDLTSERVDEAVAHHRQRGLDIVILRRRERAGFKAGALAAGLLEARGSLTAVFDADFVPPREFLRRLVPSLADPSIGMVQARWGHLNRSRSSLTEAQAVMLDAHFLLEHEARARSGLFFNFNGTAGIWRRSCIEDSGGWSAETLTEDLDLSYRAQIRGWRFAYIGDVECRAELPGDMEALKVQQRRWTQGSIQTALKILPSLWRSGWPLRAKIESVFHLTSNLSYPLLLVLVALMLPLMNAIAPRASVLGAWLHAGILAFGVLPVLLFLAAGQVAAGFRRPGAIARGVAAALILGVGLSANNARAVLRAFSRGRSGFERTPKTGDVLVGPAPSPERIASRRAGWAEWLMAGYALALAVQALRSGHDRALPFLALLMAGFGAVGWASRVARGPRPT